MKKNNQNPLILSSNGIVCQSCVKQACLRNLFGKHKTEWFPWFIFKYSALFRRTFFDIFYIFSLLCGTRAGYSLALDTHYFYYLFKLETGRGGKCSKCQQETPY